MKILLELDRVKSKLFSIKWFDIIKGLSLSVITALLTKTAEVMSVPGVYPTREQLVSACAIVFISYLIKNFFSNSAGLPMPEPKPQTNETPNALGAGNSDAGL